MLNLPEKAVMADDRFIIVRSGEQTFLLVADDVQGIIDSDSGNFVEASEFGAGSSLDGALRQDDGIVLSYDIDYFLPGEESKRLVNAIKPKPEIDSDTGINS